MIKKFNTHGAVALYKREFASCLESGNYEGAIISLLKFSEAKSNPYFHSAMGILYFLMTQDSEDKELLPLAFREFMMHLISHPDSRVTYRNLLAVAILRRDPAAIARTSDFIEMSGQDVKAIVDELSDYGLDIFNDEGIFIDVDRMFLPCDYGEIADDVFVGNDEDSLDFAEPKRETAAPKIIDFKGIRKDKSVEPTQSEDKIMRIKTDGVTDDPFNAGDMFDVMIKLIREEEGEVEFAQEVDDYDIISDEPSDLAAKLALRRAQKHCISGEFDKALTELDTIDRDCGRLYYCAECVRANIMLDLSRYEEAQNALDRAFSVLPDGALAGTIQCSLYEVTDNCSRIPDTLKKIDVTDYVDSDHVYRALRFAIAYCTPEDALMLLEDYIDEFNSFDLRSIRAQMLYNSGEKKEAIKELKTLASIQYDDFNAQYYYLMAKAGVEKMPLHDETPQNILGMIVDNTIAIIHSDMFKDNTELIESEPFKYGLEVFLTLEFRHTRNIVKIMFETLNMLATDKRLEEKMRGALVSPYVEELVKAVILGRLLSAYNGKTEFLVEQSFCPMSYSSEYPPLEDADDGYYMAYALCFMFLPSALKALSDFYDDVKGFFYDDYSREDIAYFLWNSVKTKFKYANKEVDERVHYALGYQTKTKANSTFKLMASDLPKP